jgi:hypothetical protein
MRVRGGMPARFAFLVLVGLIIGCATMRASDSPPARLSAAQSAIAGWSESSRLSAMLMIDEYGPPDRSSAERLVWNDKGPYKKLTAWNVPPSAAVAVAGDIETTVSYPVPPERREALEKFSPQVQVSLNGTELSARSDSQEVNRLTLNLAALVIAGLDPAAARHSYANALRLQAAGKSSALVAELLFRPTPQPRPLLPFRLSLSPDPLIRDPLWHSEPFPYSGVQP